MKVVYIAGKFRGLTTWDVEENVRRAERVGFEVALLGASPLIPHANTRVFAGTLNDAYWLEATAALLRKSDAALFIRGWESSVGARGEHEEAQRLDIPCFYEMEDGLSLLKGWLTGETHADVQRLIANR
jgi:hypothetical protein